MWSRRVVSRYSIVEFTPEDCTYIGYAVNKTVNPTDTEQSAVTVYRVPEGGMPLEDVTEEYT